jgi:hypothetical protein
VQQNVVSFRFLRMLQTTQILRNGGFDCMYGCSDREPTSLALGIPANLTFGRFSNTLATIECFRKISFTRCTRNSSCDSLAHPSLTCGSQSRAIIKLFTRETSIRCFRILPITLLPRFLAIYSINKHTTIPFERASSDRWYQFRALYDYNPV